MIHKYLRAAGFSKVKDRKAVEQLIRDTVHGATDRRYVKKDGDILAGIISRDYADRIGISVCGEFNDEDVFMYDYYYPYLKGTGISTAEELNIERHCALESYAGICDDARVGVSLIFYLQNIADYIKACSRSNNPLKGSSLTLSAFSLSGTIMMPIMKTAQEVEAGRKKAANRFRLITQAKKGNESAIESLTLSDMDAYTTISKKIRESDVFTLVDSYFMPFGVECDHYSVLGEIVNADLVENNVTNEKIHILKIVCNELYFDVCINEADLMGEPAKGRRFKGDIWMQGKVNFPMALMA